MDETVFNSTPGQSLGPQVVPSNPIRVLLLDDREENLVLRSAILRQKGYRVVTSSSIEEDESKLGGIDIAVLDYHLGAGKFGTDVAETLRRKRPQVPIIILSATLERKFGGIADMHLLKGYSSVDDLVNALRSFEAKKRGRPVVVDARDFYYSRISMAMGDDIVLEILDREGNWQFVNDYFASIAGHKRAWFVGKNLFEQFPQLGDEWREIVRTVADTRETYIDRRGFRGASHLPIESPHWSWNVLIFPIKLHDDRDGAVLTARLIEKK
jgi:two-component system, OmpR family, response regulator